jgi:hypothetical protein
MNECLKTIFSMGISYIEFCPSAENKIQNGILLIAVLSLYCSESMGVQHARSCNARSIEEGEIIGAIN